MKKFSSEMPVRTVGLDLGDRRSVYCVLDASGAVVQRGQVWTRASALQTVFGRMPPSRVVLEVGTHSPWVSRMLAACGHEVVVANPRRVRLISDSITKSDRLDAELLGRLGRVDPQLLHPVQHRGEQLQADRAVLRARDTLVRARSSLIVSIRCQVKSFGERLLACSAAAFASKVSIPQPLRPALEPLVAQVRDLTQQIRAYDRLIEELCEQRYPEVRLLRQIPGVGALTAFAFVAAVEDPGRFGKSRDVGPFLGLVPRRAQSGQKDPRLGITKAGDPYARRVLVQAAQYILGPFGPRSRLRAYGERITEQGGRGAKRRAVVAVARKLCVLMHRLWVTGGIYDPQYGARLQPAA